MRLSQLRQRRAEILARQAELRDLVAPFAASDTEWTPEQRTQFEAHATEAETLARDLTAVDADIRRLEMFEAAPQINGGGRRQPVPGINGPDLDAAFSARGRDLRDLALRTVEAAEAGQNGATVCATLRRIDDVRLDRLAAVTATDEYRSAFAEYMRSGHSSPVLEASRELQASLSVGSSGGYLVPVTIDPTLVTTGATSLNPFRRRATVRQIVGSSQKFPTVDDVAASFSAELTDPDDDGTDAGGPTITAHRAQALLQATPEIEEDFGMTPDVAALLFAEAKDRLEQTKFTLGAGDGSNEPYGLITRIAATSGSRVATATGDTLVWADIYSALGALPQKFRRSGADTPRSTTGWMLNILMINLLRRLAGTDPQFAGAISDPTADRPSQMLGYWLDENSDIDGTLTADADNDVAIFGDFSRFIIADRLGATVEYIPHYVPSGSSAPRRAWWMRWRVGSNVRDTNAFRLIRA